MTTTHTTMRTPVGELTLVGAGGRLTGYAGGLDRKRFLFELEGADRRGAPEELTLSGG